MTKEYDFDNPYNIYELELSNGMTRTIELEELKELNLNPENHLPDLQGRKTIVSNYVLDFWMRFLKPTAFCIYLQLVKMAYGEKDHAWPSNSALAELTGTSVRTVQNKMDELIDHNLVTVIHVKDARTLEKKNNVYLMPTVIPLISVKQFEELPKRLQKKHDEYMDYIKKQKIMFVPDYHNENIQNEETAD